MEMGVSPKLASKMFPFGVHSLVIGTTATRDTQARFKLSHVTGFHVYIYIYMFTVKNMINFNFRSTLIGTENLKYCFRRKMYGKI